MSSIVDIEMAKNALDTQRSIETVHQGSVENQNELKREFKPRQVAMFAIACSIGTGLIIGSGTALARGGPASLFIAYALVGINVFFIMTALGEFATFLPMNKGFGGYATRLVDPALGFATGWNYFFKYAFATPTNLTAAGLIIQYWRPDLNVAIWITIFGVAVILINLLHVSNLGETEFWLGLIKITIIGILIITCFIIAMGGGPNHDRTGFRYWSKPGAFAPYLLKGRKGYLLGFWAAMVQACFSYTGTEVVGIAFGETPNPRKNVPRAVRQTFWRIAVFYVLASLVLGMAVPRTSPLLVGAIKSKTSASASPFVVAIKIAGIKVFPDIVNAGLLIFVVSAASSDIYCASRSLYGLARDGQAPKVFAKTTKAGVPVYAVIAPSLFIALAYMNASSLSSVVFNYFVSLVTVFAVLNWFSILLSYQNFRRGLKAQGISHASLPYVGRFQPWGSYYSLLLTTLVVIFQGYDAFIHQFTVKTFVLKYIGVAVYVVNIVGWKLYMKTKFVTPIEMDLVTGRLQVDPEEEFEQEEKKGPFWRRLTKRQA